MIIVNHSILIVHLVINKFSKFAASKNYFFSNIFQAGVRKECDACAEQIPVACKTCPECNHELIPERKDSVGPNSVGRDF